jgi:PII-like signaling protein
MTEHALTVEGASRVSRPVSPAIEITDSEEKINAFLPVLDGMISGGLVTLEKVRAIRYLGTTRTG